MEILLKLIIVIGVVGTLRSSNSFQSMSRELDDSAMAALRKIMDCAEESGFPPQIIPLLMLLTVLTFMAGLAVTMPGGR